MKGRSATPGTSIQPNVMAILRDYENRIRRLEALACCGAVNGSFPELVVEIGGTTIRGYWRLGEASGLFADTSGYNPGDPADLLVDGSGLFTRHVSGCLNSTIDDGAWDIDIVNNPGGANYARAQPNGGENVFPGTQSSFTVVAWINLRATVVTDPSWRGAILNNAGIIAGAPSFERGWSFEVFWPGGVASPSLRLTRSNAAGSGGQVYAEIPGLIPGNCYMVSGTFDGTTIEVGVNGASFVSTPDTLRAIPENNGLTLGLGVAGQLYGVMDEVAIWATVLTHTDLSTLFSSAF